VKTAAELIAQAHRQDNMDKMPDLWAPENAEPSSPSRSNLQAANATLAAHSDIRKNVQIQSETGAEVPRNRSSLEPNTFEKPQKDEHATKEPRAPPLRYFRKCLPIAAGLIALILAAI